MRVLHKSMLFFGIYIFGYIIYNGDEIKQGGETMPTLFITAGAKNTGFAIAQKFAEHGFDVALSSRNLEEAREAFEFIICTLSP